MKKNFINNCHVQGYLFDHDLQLRTSAKGIEYIGGIVNVATDEDALNVVPVHFIYVTETYSKSGKPNPNFAILKTIIEENDTYSVVGKSECRKVRIDGNIGVNDFVTRDGEMASPKRVVGSFIHFMGANENVNGSAEFDADMIITNCVEREVEDGDDYIELNGYVFDFRNSVLPITISVNSKSGMKYFVDQDISKSNPLCTEVWGNIVSTTIVKEETVETAFGAPKVTSTSRTLRAWNVEGCSTEPYEWDSEEFVTKAELKEAMATREEHLAEVRKRNEEYRNSQNSGNKKSGSAFPGSKSSGNVPEAAIKDDEDFIF